MRFRLRTLLIVLAVGPVLLAGGCGSGTVQPAAPAAKPLRASPQREAEILRGSGDIKSGMTAADVERLVGTPDQVLPLYEPVVKNAKQIGTTHWYIIEESSDKPANSKAVRVSFDLDGRVTAIDRLGFDNSPLAP
jgi:hypothetical protein